MTEQLVRDLIQDGLWHVFVDGIEIGELFADESVNESTRYSFVYQGYHSSISYEWLAEAEHDLMSLFRTDYATNQFRPLPTDPSAVRGAQRSS